jgi:hypothetical protein
MQQHLKDLLEGTLGQKQQQHHQQQQEMMNAQALPPVME